MMCDYFGGPWGMLPVLSFKCFFLFVQACRTGKLVITEVQNSLCNFKKEHPFFKTCRNLLRLSMLIELGKCTHSPTTWSHLS